MVKFVAGLIVAVVLGGGAWVARRAPVSPVQSAIGTHPGGVGQGVRLAAFHPADGDLLVGFSSGCFWGSEQAFRKMPGIVATAVGYTGGSLAFPTYEQAHKTGHLETVLVEFDPRRTPFAALLKTFWSLPRSTMELDASKSSHGAAIWLYDLSERSAAESSRIATKRKLGYQVRVDIRPALPFYLAEEYHQQYDEKAGKELCPAVP